MQAEEIDREIEMAIANDEIYAATVPEPLSTATWLEQREYEVFYYKYLFIKINWTWLRDVWTKHFRLSGDRKGWRTEAVTSVHSSARYTGVVLANKRHIDKGVPESVYCSGFCDNCTN